MIYPLVGNSSFAASLSGNIRAAESQEGFRRGFDTKHSNFMVQLGFWEEFRWLLNVNTERLGLDIGCGNQKRTDLLGLDFRRVEGVDIVAAAKMLPFRSESFDGVFSSHTIEHFSHLQVVHVLKEWIRVLKKNGTFEIRCPDLHARAFLFSLKPNWESMRNIYGRQDYLGNYHKSGFSYGILKRCLEDLGITSVKRIVRGYKGLPFIPDSLHVKGYKR